jgi:hypothetical protein
MLRRPLVTAPPGSRRGLRLVAEDIAAARGELLSRGAPVAEIHPLADGRWRPGVEPHHARYLRPGGAPDL